MREVSDLQYRYMANAILNAFQKGWTWEVAAKALLTDSPSLNALARMRMYSPYKLAAMVTFVSVWQADTGKWILASNSDQTMTIDRYAQKVIRRMGTMQPESFADV